jgi:hypothetical protein
MSGYVASARLQGGSTRFVAAAGPGSGADLDERDRDRDGDHAWVELAGRPFGERLAARWDEARETWSQMTFFLFDPESWR